MSLFSFLKPKEKSERKEGGFDLLSRWANSDQIFPDNFDSLINAYKNIVYTCAKKNADVTARQKLHLYMVAPKGYKSKAFSGFSISDKKYRDDVLDRSPASTKAQVLYSGDYDVKEINAHPFLDLFYNPNNFMAFTEFMQLSDLYCELTGNDYWLISKNIFGIPERLDILPSQNMRPIAGKRSYVKAYEYHSSEGMINYSPENIFHCRFPNPKNMILGMSPLAAVVKSVELDNYGLEYGTSIFKNAGVLAGYFRTKDNLNETSFKRIKAEIRGFKGYKNAGQTPILDNGLEYYPTSISPAQLFDAMITKKTDKDIARAYGVPISLIDVENVNKANAQTGNNVYEEQTIDPRNRLFADKMNQAIIPLYEQNDGVTIFCAFDNPAKEDNAFVLKKQETFVKWGIASPNEIRNEEGKADREGGDSYLIPVNYMMIENGKLLMPAGDNNGNNNTESE